MTQSSRLAPSRALTVGLLFFLAAVSAWTTDATAQVVTGTVVDAVTGFPVAGALVGTLDAEDRERLAVVTDSAGRFALPVTPGTFSFRVRHIGYETLVTEPLELDARTRISVEIRLGPRPVEMEPLVVQARRSMSRSEAQFQRRMAEQRSMGLGRFITRAEIARTAVPSVNHLLTREMGLELRPVGGTDVILIRARGGLCMPTIFVDGVRVVNDPLFPIDLSTLFVPEALEGIEIYRRPIHAPAELGLAHTSCGAIALWTRSDFEGGRPHTRGRLAFAVGWVVAALLLFR
jgi:hypothetical protein